MSAKFNATGEALQATADLVDSSTDYACTFWARVKSAPTGSHFVSLLEIVQMGIDGLGIYTLPTDSNKFYLYVGNGVSSDDTLRYTFSTNLLPFAYSRSGNNHSFYCDGQFIGTVTLDITALTFDALNLGEPGLAVAPEVDMFDFREWNNSLTFNQIKAEWRSSAPVKTIDLWRDCALLADPDDQSGNGFDLAPAGSVSYIGMNFIISRL